MEFRPPQSQRTLKGGGYKKESIDIKEKEGIIVEFVKLSITRLANEILWGEVLLDHFFQGSTECPCRLEVDHTKMYLAVF